MQNQKQNQKTALKFPELTGSMVVGFIVGFAISAMVAGFIAWAALSMRQKELAAEYGLAMAVIVLEPIEAGEPLNPKKLAQRAMPQLVVTDNAVLPTEVDPLFGKAPQIGFSKGDVLLRSAFGLEPRAADAPEVEPAPSGD